LVGKQSQSHQEEEPKIKITLPHEEEISSELLLRGHTLTEDIIAQLRKKNIETTDIELEVDDYWAKSNESSMAKRRVKLSQTNAYIQYENPMSKKRKLLWLRQVQNQRSNAFYSLRSHIQNGIIDESEIDLFEFPPGITDFPYRQIYQFHRIMKADGSQYLSTHEQWTGINKNATVVSLSIPDLYYYIKPTVKYELRAADGSPIREGYSAVDNKTIQIATTQVSPSEDIAGRKEYILPFSAEVAYSALKLAHGTLGDVYNGSSMAIMKEGMPSVYGVKDPKVWAEGDFDVLWDEISKPQAQINVDPAKLVNYLKNDAGSKEKPQYG
jgi:hypothetical protein